MRNLSIVELCNVSKIFKSNGNKIAAITNVSLQANTGKLILFLGPSGSGKTTLLTLIAGLIEATSGSILLYGKKINEYSTKEIQALRANQMGFIFQSFNLINSLTVLENVSVVCRFSGYSKSDSKNKAYDLLKELKIESLFKKFPNNLSQGEKQRVAVARAIANEAQLIIADEPTACLESNQGYEIIRLLHNFAKEKNKCIIVASHDLRIKNFADEIFYLNDGQMIHE